MKSHTIYECETCGKKSKNINEIEMCEALHLGLTKEEFKTWKNLKAKCISKGAIVSIRKNENTDKEWDKAIDELLEFEREHGLSGKSL